MLDPYNRVFRWLLDRAGRAPCSAPVPVSPFVLHVSLNEAERVIKEETQIMVSSAEYERLCENMDAPLTLLPRCLDFLYRLSATLIQSISQLADILLRAHRRESRCAYKSSAIAQ